MAKKKRKKIKIKGKKKIKFELTTLQLKKISFFLTLVGILIIFLISTFLGPKSIDGCEIEDIREGKYVEISGIITDEIDLAKEFMLFKLENNSCEVDIICTCVRSLEDQHVIVQGKIQSYKGKKQILAEKIENG